MTIYNNVGTAEFWAKILSFEVNFAKDNRRITERNMNTGNNLSFVLEPRKATTFFFYNLKTLKTNINHI